MSTTRKRDFVEPLQNKYFLFIEDAYSKWLEFFPMKNAITKKTIQKLRDVFTGFGLPRTIVSDNGPQFISQVFQTFLQANGIHHKPSY